MAETIIQHIRDTGLDIGTEPALPKQACHAFMRKLVEEVELVQHPYDTQLTFGGDLKMKGDDGFAVAYTAVCGAQLAELKDHLAECVPGHVSVQQDSVAYRFDDRGCISQIKCSELYAEKADSHHAGGQKELYEADLYITLDILYHMVEPLHTMVIGLDYDKATDDYEGL
jgi:DNA recombination-dependent growth factor C